MHIIPRISLSAKALIELDAPTAEGFTTLGFDSGRAALPPDTDHAATLSITLAPAAVVDVNFRTFSQNGGPAATDAEGNGIEFSHIYALGLQASAAVSVAAAPAAPWLHAPLPATATLLDAITAIGLFPLTGGSHSMRLTNPSAAAITLEFIALGHKN